MKLNGAVWPIQRVIGIGSVVMALLVAFVLYGRAQNPPTTARKKAEIKYDSGRGLYQGGNYAEARDAFLDADELSPALAALNQAGLASIRERDWSAAATIGIRFLARYNDAQVPALRQALPIMPESMICLPRDSWAILAGKMSGTLAEVNVALGNRPAIPIKKRDFVWHNEIPRNPFE